MSRCVPRSPAERKMLLSEKGGGKKATAYFRWEGEKRSKVILAVGSKIAKEEEVSKGRKRLRDAKIISLKAPISARGGIHPATKSYRNSYKGRKDLPRLKPFSGESPLVGEGS